MTRIFLDTGFTGLHQRTTLISMAFCLEEDFHLYGELIVNRKDARLYLD
ncbi:MAG: hypothetical protein WAT37_11715 [Saprospiraceae bacterium]